MKKRHGTLPVIILLLLVFIAGCQTELSTNLNENEANEIMALLLNNGLDVEKIPSGDNLINLMIAEEDFTKAIKLMHSHGLPREKFVDMGDIFKSEGMISSPMEEWARFLYARSQELSKMVSDIDGVVLAKVHVAIPKDEGLVKEDRKPKASVLIKIDEKKFHPDIIPKIKQMITFSVEDLTYNNVSVVTNPTETIQGDVELINYFGILVHNSSKSRLTSFMLVASGLVLLLLVAIFISVYLLLKARKAAPS